MKAQGAILRSKADWLEFGGKPTKYFLNLEKANYNKRVMYRLKNNNDQMISGRKEVLKEMTEFYKQLYTEDRRIRVWDQKQYLKDLGAPQITEDRKKDLGKPIELHEISAALKDMKHNKSPGCDGIPPEFYKVFWSKLKKFFHEVIQEAVTVGKFHLSARRGVITVIEKQGRDPNLLKNWRPISLLNTDLKIYSKVIAAWLQVIIGEIIHESQTGFVKGRFIGENIVKVLNMIDYCEQNKQSAILISFDFEKAFDKVSWSAIEMAFKAFNLGEEFTHLVKLLYTELLSCVLNGGYTGEYFQLTRSTRQGDPCSALIFAIVVEILGIKIRMNSNIKGIDIGGNYEIVSEQYADDLWTILQPSTENINELLREIDKFSIFSGLNINAEKSVAIKLGPLRHTNAKYYTLKQLAWVDGPIRILGVDFYSNPEVTVMNNYMDVLVKIDRILGTWKRRKLTLTAKIVLLNTLMTSQLQYKMLVLPSLEAYFYKIYKQRMLDFLWNRKAPRIRYDKLIQLYENNGLQLIDPETKELALKTKWVEYLRGKEAPWFYLNTPIKTENLWKCNFKYEDVKYFVKESKYNFINDVMRAWAKFNYVYPQNVKSMMNQYVWGNSDIRRAGKPILERSYLNPGINKVHQLCVKEGQLMNYQQCTDKYGEIIDFLQFNALKTAIPMLWKKEIKILKQEDLEEIKDCEEVYKFEMYKTKKLTNVVYNHLIYDKLKSDGAKTAWSKDLSIELDQEVWSNAYSLTLKTTLCDKIRYFQYQILNRTLVTNRK